MNQNGDEKRIQQLFREISDGDRLQTPAFSRVVQGASSNATLFRFGISRRLAFTFAALCLVMIALAVLTLRHQPTVDNRLAVEDSGFKEPPIPIPPVEKPSLPRLEPRLSEPVKFAVKRVHHRRPVNELALAMKLSTWKSPTASLLKTTEDDNKLLSLPKLGESLRTLRSYSLDDLN